MPENKCPHCQFDLVKVLEKDRGVYQNYSKAEPFKKAKQVVAEVECPSCNQKSFVEVYFDAVKE